MNVFKEYNELVLEAMSTDEIIGDEPYIGEFLILENKDTKKMLKKLKSKFKETTEWSYYDSVQKEKVIIIHCIESKFREVQKFLVSEGAEDHNAYINQRGSDIGQMITLNVTTSPHADSKYVGKFAWDFPGKTLPMKWYKIY